MAVFSFLRKVLIISGTGEIGYLGPKSAVLDFSPNFFIRYF